MGSREAPQRPGHLVSRPTDQPGVTGGDARRAIPEAEVHVVRNLYLGSEKKFELYNGSKMKSGIEGRGSHGTRVAVHRPIGSWVASHASRSTDSR